MKLALPLIQCLLELMKNLNINKIFFLSEISKLYLDFITNIIRTIEIYAMLKYLN